MENSKECKIIGYGKYNDKETSEEMYRICIAVNSQRENYYGKAVVYAFLPYDEILSNNLKNAINDSSCKVYYKTTDNIETGRTKVSELIFN